MIRFYLRMLEKRPALTMAVGTGALMSLGDIIAQTAIEKRHRDGTYQLTRTLRFLGFGLFFTGPTLRIWYRTLDRVIPAGVAFKPVKMMALDQLLFAPTFLTFFWVVMGIVKGDNYDELVHGVKESLPSVIISNYKIWPAAQLFNFYVMPPQHRVLFANTIALGWNTYISWKVENQKREDNSVS